MTIYVNARAIIERETRTGIEILLQVRTRSGEPERWELPGGQIDPFESVLNALEREIAEETGLHLTLVREAPTRAVHDRRDGSVETFEPLFAYQTLRGPVDSLGFYFRCSVAGDTLAVGDGAKQPTWFSLEELRARLTSDPEQFDWLTCAALERYLSICQEWRSRRTYC